VFFVSAMLGNLSIGIRHILPVIPLLYLFIAVVLVEARLSGLLGALALVGCIETARIHPDYLAFFNMAAGGPDRGQRFLLDSNLDWGQDVKRLAEWLKSPEAAGKRYTLRIFTFPHDRIAQEYGLDPSAFGQPPGDLLAISKSIRHGLLGAEMLPGGEMTHTEDYSWLARFPVVKRIGYSIEVYDLSGSQPEKP
jgi:hypothetical protein